MRYKSYYALWGSTKGQSEKTGLCFFYVDPIIFVNNKNKGRI